jgi:hypothetical protein
MEGKKMSEYVKQLKDFQAYLAACFEVLMENGDGKDNDSFYASDFEITFRGKKVTLYNGADVFQGIEEIVQTEIDDCEEG